MFGFEAQEMYKGKMITLLVTSCVDLIYATEKNLTQTVTVNPRFLGLYDPNLIFYFEI